MKTIVHILSLFLILKVTTAVTTTQAQVSSSVCSKSRAHPDPKFSYDNGAPDNWGTHSQVCGTGQEQSPINVLVNYANQSTARRAPVIKGYLSVFHYHAASNNFKLDCASKFGHCGSVKLGHKNFSLVQVHAHSPSENHLSGKAYPLEVHFVHVNKNNEVAVVGVFFEIGEANPELERFLEAAHNRHYTVIDVEKLSMAAEADLCTFKGSLTTPPCSENVNWIVSLKTTTASLRQIGEYREMVGETSNNRPLMPPNGRQIVCYSKSIGKTSISLPGLV